jgi:predicted esterase
VTSHSNLLGLVLAVLAASGCDRTERTILAAVRPLPIPAAGAPTEPPVEAKIVPIPDDLPAFAVPGPRGTCPRMIFLHGMCGHGLGYIQAFQFTAHEHGGVVALQGDVPCGDGTFRKYSPDPAKQDARVRAALAAVCGDSRADEDADDGLTVIGYSQGAYLGERMAERFPSRYTRAVLLGAPTTPSGARLRDLGGAVMISGEHDARHRMKEGVTALSIAGVPAKYMEMPGAHHGQLLEGEKIMDEALDWLDANARQAR